MARVLSFKVFEVMDRDKKAHFLEGDFFIYVFRSRLAEDQSKGNLAVRISA